MISQYSSCQRVNVFPSAACNRRTRENKKPTGEPLCSAHNQENRQRSKWQCENFSQASTVLQGSYNSAGKIQANILMQSNPIGDRYVEHWTSHLQIYLHLWFFGGFAELILITCYFLLEIPTSSNSQIYFNSEDKESRSFTFFFSTNTLLGLIASRTVWRSDSLDQAS